MNKKLSGLFHALAIALIICGSVMLCACSGSGSQMAYGGSQMGNSSCASCVGGCLGAVTSQLLLGFGQGCIAGCAAF